jgi:hypothetical protein
MPRGSPCVVPCILLFLPLVDGSALQNRACGELYDPEALRGVRTVCVDASYLQTDVASDVKAFVTEQNQSGQSLKRINWELTNECATADAVIRVYFAPSALHIADWREAVTQVVLLIYDRPSVRVLYRTEVDVPGKKPAVLLKGPFTRLVKDIKELSH